MSELPAPGVTRQYLVFLLNGQRCAVPLSTVDRVVAAVEVTPLPGAPRAVAGFIDVQGQILPVFSLRARFGLPGRAVTPDDRLVLAQTPRRRVALLADGVEGLAACEPDDVAPREGLVPGASPVSGIARRPDGLVLIHDLERFLSADEDADLEAALSAREKSP